MNSAWSTLFPTFRSTAEAEYSTMAIITCVLTWLLALLKDLQISLPQPTLLFCDNQAVLHITANPIFYERPKHIEIYYHIVCEKS